MRGCRDKWSEEEKIDGRRSEKSQGDVAEGIKRLKVKDDCFQTERGHGCSRLLIISLALVICACSELVVGSKMENERRHW